jgi:hypothetical protein
MQKPERNPRSIGRSKPACVGPEIVKITAEISERTSRDLTYGQMRFQLADK